MTECDNAEMRDLLPDLVNDTLSADERERVRVHVASCGACRDEERLLRAMRAARPVARGVDVARIVSALPRGIGMPVSASASRGAAPSLTAPSLTAPSLTAPSLTAPSLTVTRSDAVPAARTRTVFAGVWRMAATVAVAVIGGGSVLWHQQSQGSLDRTSPVASSPTAAGTRGSESPSASDVPGVQAAGDLIAMIDTPRAAGSAPKGAVTGTTTRQTALSLGDLSDYSDDDLQRMLDRLEKWDGTTAADPVPTVPIVPVTERGTR